MKNKLVSGDNDDVGIGVLIILNVEMWLFNVTYIMIIEETMTVFK